MSLLKSFSEIFEIFGTNPSFNIKGHKRYPSIFNLILSILFIISSMIIVIIYLCKSLLHRNPTISSYIYTDNNLDIQKGYLGNDNFFFGIGLQDRNYNKYINESIFKINAYKITRSLNEFIQNEIEITTCDKLNLKVASNYFSSLKLNKLFCIRNKTDLYLKGFFNSKIFSYIKINFQICNKNKDENCLDNDELNKILFNNYLYIYYTDFNIDLQDYKNPSIVIGKNFYTSISSNFFKEIYIYTKKLDIVAKNINYIYSSNDNKLTFDKFYEMTFLRDNEDTFLNIYLALGDQVNVYKRNYSNFFCYLPDIVSLIFVIYFLIKFFSWIFENILYKSYICSFFNFPNTDIMSKLNNLYEKSKISKGTSKESQYFNIKNKNKNKIILSKTLYKKSKDYKSSNDVQDKLTEINKNLDINLNKNNKILNNSNIKYNKTMVNSNTINKIKLNNDQSSSSLIDNTYKRRKSLTSKLIIYNKPIKCNNNFIIKFGNNKYINNSNSYFNNNCSNFPFINNLEKFINSCEYKKNLDNNKFNKKNINKNNKYFINILTCNNLIKLFFCNVEEIIKRKIINKSFENYNLYFDVIRYLKLFNDNDLIKNIILNNEQFKIVETYLNFHKNSNLFTNYYLDKNNILRYLDNFNYRKSY